MEILRDWLNAYDPEPDIRKNGRHLQNVRLFSENLRFSPSTVYLMPMERDRIVCSNENDILVLRSDDVNEVFNDILNAFEYYNDREMAIVQKIDAGCTAKELLEQLSDMTGFFLILADAGFYMQETAGPEEILQSQNGLDRIIEEHMLPLSAVSAINAQAYIRRHDVPPYLTEVPGLGTACVTNLFPDESHAGWLIACTKDSAFSQGEKDLVDCAGRMAELWLSRNKNADEHSRNAGMLQELLEGSLAQKEQIKAWMAALGWMETDEKQVFALKPAGEEPLPPAAVARSLELSFPDSFVLFRGTEALLLANYALVGRNRFRQQLETYLEENRFAAGAGSCFQDISELKEKADEAERAAAYAAPEAGRILSFREILLPYAVSVLKEHAEQDPVHPAVTVLAEYDAAHDTSLTETLRVFLQENCSYTAAARALYIHRSTLIYRMERIAELTQADLTDPEERFLLQLSFYLTEQTEGSI